MDAKRRVVLYGDTLVLAAVGRALSARGDLRVISLDPSQATAPEDLASLRPCVVILDLTEVSVESALGLMRGGHDLTLIGLDPTGDSFLMLSRERAHALTTEDLVWLIEPQAEAPGRDPSGEATRPQSIARRQSTDLASCSRERDDR